ncbi:MAG: hypothetical protein Kow0040_17400 [Thermogutta sp.]
MPAVMPSAYNVAVPNLDATNRLIVDFGRNPSEFPVLRYSQIVPVKKSTGLYLKMTVEEAGRILNSDLADFVWPDGADAPIGLDNTESFEFVPYRCERYAPHAAVGDLTRDNADWDIVNQNASIKARQAMTARTQMAANRIFTESNYDANNVIDVNATFGAKWNAATTANMVIRKSINAAVQRIVSATLGAVKAKDLVLVLGDTVARAISESQEFADYLKGSPDALGALRYQFRDEPSAANDYGLPKKLYGVEVVVDDTRKVTTKKKSAAPTIEPVLPANMAAIVSRVGALEAPYSPVSFSTCAFFMLQELQVETIYDQINKRTLVRVVDNWACDLVAPAAGVLLKNVL